MNLAEKAAVMEQATKNGDEYTINNEHENALAQYSDAALIVKRILGITGGLGLGDSDIMDFAPVTVVYVQYMTAGCHSSIINNVDALQQEGAYREALRQVGIIDILCIEPTDDYRSFFQLAIEYVDDNSMFIIHHIKKNAETKAFWKQIVDDPRCVTTFDLYYCGIIFVYKKRYKENYIVNF